MPPADFTASEIETGRKLFAADWQFAWASSSVDNLPPMVRFTSPQPGATLGLGGEKVVRLAVDATDNVEVAYVEFYSNNQLIDTVKSAPFETTLSPLARPLVTLSF